MAYKLVYRVEVLVAKKKKLALRHRSSRVLLWIERERRASTTVRGGFIIDATQRRRCTSRLLHNTHTHTRSAIDKEHFTLTLANVCAIKALQKKSWKLFKKKKSKSKEFLSRRFIIIYITYIVRLAYIEPT